MTNESGMRSANWLNLAAHVSAAASGIGGARVAHTLRGR